MDKKEAISIIEGLIEDAQSNCEMYNGKMKAFFSFEVEALKMGLEALERS